jgi:hypothetical protein
MSKNSGAIPSPQSASYQYRIYSDNASSAPDNCSTRRRMPPSFARRGRQSGRGRFACAPLPLLRRSDDHRRDVPGPARAIAIPAPDRHLMTVATHPPAHRRLPPPPAARRNTSATPVRGRQSSCDRGQRLAPAHRRQRKRPTPPLPTKAPSAPGRRRLARQPSAILNSP